MPKAQILQFPKKRKSRRKKEQVMDAVMIYTGNSPPTPEDHAMALEILQFLEDYLMTEI